MIVGPRKTLFMDEISTGLDSSTTYQIVKCLRNFVHLMDATLMIALLQPAPETFELFDDLVLLSEGYVVYHGPQADVIEFFESLGFRLPPRKGVADFLQEVLFIWCFIAPRCIWYFNWSLRRLPQERIRHNTGLIIPDHMNSFLFMQLPKRLGTPDMVRI